MPRKRSSGGKRPGARAPKPVAAGGGIDLGPLPQLTGYVLRRAQLAGVSHFITTFQRLDIRPAQYSVLTVIEHNPGLNQTQLSYALNIKRANLVGLLDVLEARGLAARKRTAGDKRAFGLFLTDRGAALMVELHALVQEHERRNLGKIGKTGRDQLLRLLQRLDEEAP